LLKRGVSYTVNQWVIYCLVVIFLIGLQGCNSTKYVPEGNYLLDKNDIRLEDKNNIDPKELRSLVNQQPNKNILGFRFYLHLYNLSNINKTAWPHGWLRKIGEEPVVYDRYQKESTKREFIQYLENKGYYNAQVKDTVIFRKNQAEVVYRITHGEPYRLKEIEYFFEDTGIRSLVLSDTVNSLLQRGMVFDKEELQAERVRLVKVMKNKGYFNFSKEYIFFEARKVPESDLVRLLLGIKGSGLVDSVTGDTLVRHRKYRICDVYVKPDYVSSLSSSISDSAAPFRDTLLYNDIYFVFDSTMKIKPNVITQANFIQPGDRYSLENVTSSYRHLTSVGLFKLVDIRFRELGKQYEPGGNHLLDCNIELTRRKVQSYQFEIVGTNSSGDFGVRGNLLYNNWNLFRGAEIFRMKFTGAIEALENRRGGQLKNMHELGIESGIDIPKFLLPFRFEGFVKKYNPKTSLSLAYNYQNRPDYVRTIANFSFGYNWRGNSYINHSVFPVELNFVKIPFLSNSFKEVIEGTYLESSYDPHIVLNSRYGFRYSNQVLESNRNFVYIRLVAESAGNILSAVSKLVEHPLTDGSYEYFGVPFFQYMKGDMDFRYYNKINSKSQLVYRFYTGVGFPYGNSGSLPFEKQYFAGGPNSIRAWRTRSLGPGSYPGDTISQYENYTGDIKLEGNIEYRFKLFWKLEGALFADAGNIWSVRGEDEREGALFEWNKFYKDIAVGGGFGTRFDLSFLLIRFDFGLKLRDPAINGSNKWIVMNRPLKLDDFAFQFGIGYPF